MNDPVTLSGEFEELGMRFAFSPEGGYAEWKVGPANRSLLLESERRPPRRVVRLEVGQFREGPFVSRLILGPDLIERFPLLVFLNGWTEPSSSEAESERALMQRCCTALAWLSALVLQLSE